MRNNTKVSNPGNLEVEIKLRLTADPSRTRRQLLSAGFRVRKRRVFESNTVYDTAGAHLRELGHLLRLRRTGRTAILTFKGATTPGRHKSREEIESGVSGPDNLELILSRLSFQPVFRYEKYRTEYGTPGEPGVVTLDETPIGNFLEIEGNPDWIDRTAQRLGFAPEDYITKSYGALYFDFCKARGVTPCHMVFSPEPSPRAPPQP